MSSQRLAGALMLLVLVLMLVSGYWLWGRLQDLAPPPSRTLPTPMETATPTVTPLATVVEAPPGYRLAGVAVGEPESFAVVEAPSGPHGLYRVGDDVPGLGRLLRIEAERIVVQSEAGQFELWLMPAPTMPPGRRPGATGTAAPSHRTPVPTSRRQPVPPGAGTAPESTPSSARGRSAS
jgi:hypothetical protein